MNSNTVLANIEKNHKGEDEFIQALREVYLDVAEYEKNISKEDINSFFTLFSEPDRTIKFKVEWFDDQGKLQVNRGYRVQYNNCLGPYKGGLRFHPSVNESILKFLGFEQVFKNALTDMPMGGGKGGSDFDPKGKSEQEIIKFCKSFMEELQKYIGADVDVPAGDIGVGTREIGYMYGHYLKLTNHYTGVLTGKHPNFGGSCGREEATGYGAVHFANFALKEHKKSLKGQRVLVSGSGNVALFAVEKLIEQESVVLTVSDSGGTLFFKEGIDKEMLERLKKFKFKRHGRLKNFDSNGLGSYMESKSPWSLEAEIAFPCATQNEISGEDAKKLVSNGVFCIVEGANMPLDDNAQEVVMAKDVIYLPGKAANAGGVAVSGLERTQNATYKSLTSERVENLLCEIMKEIHDNCLKYAPKNNGVVNYKAGANLYAFNKVFETSKFLRW